MGVASLVLGIIAIIIGIVSAGTFGWVGAIMGIVGIILGALGKKHAPEGKSGVATGGLVCSIIRNYSESAVLHRMCGMCWRAG